MSEIDYDELDPGIRETVRWLNERGFRTTDSGDGSKAAEMPCAMAEPNVAISVAPADLVQEADRLHRLLTEAGIHFSAIGTGGRFIQASYDPADGTASACVLLIGVGDRDLFWYRCMGCRRHDGGHYFSCPARLGPEYERALRELDVANAEIVRLRAEVASQKQTESLARGLMDWSKLADPFDLEVRCSEEEWRRRLGYAREQLAKMEAKAKEFRAALATTTPSPPEGE